MSEEKIIQRLADFCDMPKHTTYTCDMGHTHLTERYDFNPLSDWNHWRKVEEKVMEDSNFHPIEDETLVNDLWESYIFQLTSMKAPFSLRDMFVVQEADLPTRCRSLVSVLQDD